jgi:hypothetical protein
VTLAVIVVAADLVAYAADGADEGAVGAGVNFAAEVVDVHVNHIGDRVAVHAPNFFDDGVARDGAAGIAQEELEEGVLLGAELDGAAGAADLVGDAIDLQILEQEHVLGGTAAAAKDGMGAGDEFGGSEGFYEKVVGTTIQGADAFFDRGFRREQNDGRVWPEAQECADGIVGGETGKTGIQENEIEGSVLRKTGKVMGMGDHLDREILLLKAGFEKFGQSGIDFGHE